MDNQYLEFKNILSNFAPRVELALLSAEHEAKFLEMTESSKAIHNPWVFPPINPVSFKELLYRAAQENFVALVVHPKGDKNIIGIFNLSQIFRYNFLNTILGCYANIKYHGQGYMHEGLLHTIAYAFFALKLHRIEANIICDNERSVGLFRRVGFRDEGISKNYLMVDGVWRDHLKFALTYEDLENVCHLLQSRQS